MTSEPNRENALLGARWSLYKTESNSIESPGQLPSDQPVCEFDVLTTVGAILAESGIPDTADSDIDEYDWWYVGDFELAEQAENSTLVLKGLATFASVYLDGEPVTCTDNAFRTFEQDLPTLPAGRHTLAICFHSVSNRVVPRRPRALWRTGLVRDQDLRWARTTLFGRINTWGPTEAIIGVTGNVILDTASVRSVTERTRSEYADGVCLANVRISYASALEDGSEVDLVASLGDLEQRVTTVVDDGKVSAVFEFASESLTPWLPHTAGSPTLYPLLVSSTENGSQHELVNRKVGFRSCSLSLDADEPELLVNGQRVNCLGACWVPTNGLTLRNDPAQLRSILERFRDAGGNMIRIGGTMAYEEPLFYKLCDELGILVWQDFMFANMNYPFGNEEFLENAKSEIEEISLRLNRHACVAVFCGNSEVRQQAAMFGVDFERIDDTFFSDIIPDILNRTAPATGYVSGSPSGKELPFAPRSGASHYFGVGAYKRPISDAALSGVRFASECLAFSNVPSRRERESIYGTAVPQVHSPDWKQGVPRDANAGWDFEDVRDHYVSELYSVDVEELRYSDPERYFLLAEAVPGEVMRETFKIWRNPENRNFGALIWTLRDTNRGAGWGFLDHEGNPKPTWYFLKRAWSAVGVDLLHEGLNGTDIVCRNDTDENLPCTLRIEVLRNSSTIIARESTDIVLATRSEQRFNVETVLGRFIDCNYAYRFGPRGHEVLLVSLIDTNGTCIASDELYPVSRSIAPIDSVEIDIEVEENDAQGELILRTDKFVQVASLDSPDLAFAQNYLSLHPDLPYRIPFHRVVTDRQPEVTLRGLNLPHPQRLL